MSETVKIGDIIRCKVQNPFPQTLRVVLGTQEACDYGNKLISEGRWEVEPIKEGEE
jgi:hypothetical protein